MSVCEYCRGLSGCGRSPVVSLRIKPLADRTPSNERPKRMSDNPQNTTRNAGAFMVLFALDTGLSDRRVQCTTAANDAQMINECNAQQDNWLWFVGA